MQMNLMDIIGPVALFVGVICIAAALYFVITLIKGASARRRVMSPQGAPIAARILGLVPATKAGIALTLLSHKR